MREKQIDPKLAKVLKKLLQKNPVQYDAVLDKIEEIVSASSLEHYKFLRYSGVRMQRVHVGSFVLLFHVEGDTVCFKEYAHHDEVYNK